MCSSAAELRDCARWDGKGPVSRQKLIENLQGDYFWNAILRKSISAASSFDPYEHLFFLDI